MVGNIILYINVVASSILLKSPLPIYLPPVRQARERLVEAVRHLEVVKKRQVKYSSSYLLYFAYVLAIKVRAPCPRYCSRLVF